MGDVLAGVASVRAMGVGGSGLLHAGSSSVTNARTRLVVKASMENVVIAASSGMIRGMTRRYHGEKDFGREGRREKSGGCQRPERRRIF